MGLYRKRWTRDGRKYESRTWYFSFKHPGTGRRIIRSTSTADRQAALILMNDSIREAAREKAGLADPHKIHKQRPLADHVDEWETAQLAKGNHERDSRMQADRLRKVIKALSFTFWSDISASRVQIYLGELRGLGKGARTRNGHLQATKQFCAWLVADQRVASNPLAHLKRENARADVRRARRAFEADELRWLLHTTAEGPARYGIDGATRSGMYEFAVATGLRASEVRAVTWADVDLDSARATVTVAAATAKNRRADVLPLTARVAQLLACWRAQRPDLSDDMPVFATPHVSNFCRLLREDMQAAREAWLSEPGISATELAEREASNFLQPMRRSEMATGANGGTASRFDEVLDFHSLRHTTATFLARAGVPITTSMSLMRHSSVDLTARFYTHVRIADRGAAVDQMPDLSMPTKRNAQRSA